MARENIEIVRRSTEAYSRGALDEALASWTTDAVLDWSNSRGLEAAVVRGRDEIRAYMEQFLEAFEEVRIEIEDIFEADEGVVIAENLAYIRGRDGIEVTARSAWVITFQDGRQTSLTLFQSKADALKAAGLSE
jgi:ketosteroid isomerase-like protein